MELLLFLNMTAEVEQFKFIDYLHDKGNNWRPNTTLSEQDAGRKA